ncbi:flavin oxidoreductase [Microterricola viridarii]|uniref:Flavin oxidoreductase n=2 Tax=Microterricola viridarii TaxID=412690 RepID=A0A0Y0Q1I1_9MICO|nr:flavin oxidoreductase [Microterricola viridarii]
MSQDAAAATIDQFKAAFRRHPAGVAVITAESAEGPVGLTASSVASVSAEPPVLVFSVTTSAGSAGSILAASTCVVHLLHSENVDIARSFAKSGAPRFVPEQGWITRGTGEPLLPDAAVMLHCKIVDKVAVGASTLVIAEVLEIDEGVEGSPLVYHDRNFHGLQHHSILH